MERDCKSVMEVPTGDVLILAGDIYTPWHMNKTSEKLVMEFFKRCSDNFEHVLMVAGNHEHYHGYFVDTHARIRKQIEQFENIQLLDNSAFQVGNVVFWGSTMWTDAKDGDPIVTWDIQRGMNDYQTVRYSQEEQPYGGKPRLVVDHTISANLLARSELAVFMAAVADRDVTPVVITHHAPTWESVENCYRGETLSYAYANTGLDRVIEAFPKGFWIHGHTHAGFEYTVGETTVLCNPRGYYGYEAIANKFQFKQLEV